MKHRILYAYPVCLVFLIVAGAIAIVIIRLRPLLARPSDKRRGAH